MTSGDFRTVVLRIYLGVCLLSAVVTAQQNGEQAYIGLNDDGEIQFGDRQGTVRLKDMLERLGAVETENIQQRMDILKLQAALNVSAAWQQASFPPASNASLTFRSAVNAGLWTTSDSMGGFVLLDLNNDSFLDVIYVRNKDLVQGTIAGIVFHKNGTVRLNSFAMTLSTQDSFNSIELGDINGDGFPDLLVGWVRKGIKSGLVFYSYEVIWFRNLKTSSSSFTMDSTIYSEGIGSDM